MVRWLHSALPSLLATTLACVVGCSTSEPERKKQVATSTEAVAWAGTVRLTASDAMEADQFGVMTAVDGTTAIVTAMPDEDGPGAAYVFERNGAVWRETQKLTASDGMWGDQFGIRMAVSGNIAVLTSPVTNSYGGTVYIFERRGTVWTETQKLTAPGNGFGNAISLDGDRLAVTSGGSVGTGVHVYLRSGTSFVLEQTLPIARDPISVASSVALAADVMAVGGIVPDVVKVFTRSGTTWTEGASISAPNGPTQSFGSFSLATNGVWLLIGAPYEVTPAFYAYERSGMSFVERGRLTASDSSPGSSFGGTLMLSGNLLAVGANGDDEWRGAVYIFERGGTSFVEQSKVSFPTRPANQGIGAPSLDADTLLVGSAAENYLTGAAYVLRWGAENGEVCALANECASLYCVEGVCCDTACGDPCVSCLAARKESGASGVCGVVPEGVDPREGCSAESRTSCGTTGQCDGRGACAFHAAGTQCDPATCPTERSENPPDPCDGEGTCETTATRPCEPGYLCVDGACGTSCEVDADCDTERAFACRDGACRIPQGGPCEESAHCETGHCADGVCCDTACGGQCESCALPETVGECVAVTGEPLGDREPCPTGGDPGCGSRCDGRERTECRHAPATESCISGCEEGNELVSLCDGEGSCLAGEPRPCAPYVCGELGCLDECVVGDDCVAGYRCEEGACVPGPRCSTDRLDSIRSDAVTSCGRYLCDEASGECRQRCQSTFDDCAPGFVCDPDSGECGRSPDAAEEPAGCGCRLVAPSGGDTRSWLAACALLAAAWARRRRRAFTSPSDTTGRPSESERFRWGAWPVRPPNSHTKIRRRSR